MDLFVLLVAAYLLGQPPMSATADVFPTAALCETARAALEKEILANPADKLAALGFACVAVKLDKVEKGKPV